MNDSMYTGAGDLGLYPGGRRSFAEEARIKHDFTVNVRNTTGEKVVLALFPGFMRILGLKKETTEVMGKDGNTPVEVLKDVGVSYENADLLNAAGYKVDFVANDGIIYDNGSGKVEVSSPDGLVSALQEYVMRNPQRIVSMDISVNDKDVFPTDLKIARLFPGQDVAVAKQPISTFFEPSNNQSTKIKVPDTIQADDQTVIFFEMADSQNGQSDTSIQFTFNLGASQNQGIMLANKAELGYPQVVTEKVMDDIIADVQASTEKADGFWNFF